MNTILLAAVIVLSLLPILFVSLTFQHLPKNEEYLIISIFAIVMMTINMGMSASPGAIKEKKSNRTFAALTSTLALLFLASSYGSNIDNEDCSILLGLSVISFLLASVLGHFMKDNNEEKEESQNILIYRILKTLFLLTSLVLFMINLMLDENVYKDVKSITLFTVLAFVFGVFYLGASVIELWVLLNGLEGNYEIEIICFPKITVPSITWSLIKIVSSGLMLSVFGVLFGKTQNMLDIISGILVGLSIFSEHLLY